MAGAGGRDVHPNSTHGVLIRIYPVNSFKGATSPSKSGLSGIMRVIVAVRDLNHARMVYQTGFGLACDPAHDDDSRGVRGFMCRPPAGGVIEFVSPTNTDRPFAREGRELPRGSRGPVRADAARRRAPGIGHCVRRAHHRRTPVSIVSGNPGVRRTRAQHRTVRLAWGGGAFDVHVAVPMQPGHYWIGVSGLMHALASRIWELLQSEDFRPDGWKVAVGDSRRRQRQGQRSSA